MTAILLVLRLAFGGVLKAVVGLVASPVGRAVLMALAAAAALWWAYHAGFGAGVARERAEAAQRLAEARAAVAKAEARAGQITHDVEIRVVEKLGAIRTITRTITERVPTYVTVQADAQCSVPVGFVRLHDAAAAGRLPDVPGPSEPSNDAASGVPLSAVTTVVAGNYGIAHGEIARFEALQDWVRRQAANH